MLERKPLDFWMLYKSVKKKRQLLCSLLRVEKLQKKYPKAKKLSSSCSRHVRDVQPVTRDLRRVTCGLDPPNTERFSTETIFSKHDLCHHCVRQSHQTEKCLSLR